MGKKKEPSITISPKHGVNPSLLKCPICGKDTGIALLGKLKGDEEAPREIKGDLCDDCKKKYITLIIVTDEKTKKDTGKRGYIPRESVVESLRNNDVLLISEETLKEIENGADRQSSSES